MDFDPPLERATLIRRYKRFLADVRLADGSVTTVHCANPGSMMGLLADGADTWISRAPSPTRKLAYDWQLVGTASGLVGINTALTNRLVAEALTGKNIAQLAAYPEYRREVRYGTASRVDFVLSGPGLPDCYLEVKNVTLKRDTALPGAAEFPDAVTARGARHLDELAAMAVRGARAVLLYVAQRADCNRLLIAGDIDPKYQAACRRAAAAGVQFLCYACHVSPQRVYLDRPLPVMV